MIATDEPDTIRTARAPTVRNSEQKAKQADMWDRTETTLVALFLGMVLAVLAAAWFFDDMLAIVSSGA